MKRLPLIASFLLFLLLCASAAYWGLQLFKPAPRQVAAPPRTLTAEVSPDAGAALFGGAKQRVVVATNYQLHGVILSGSPNSSVAIISTAGDPPKAIPVDQEITPGVKVQEVHRDYVMLSDGGASRRLELPARDIAQLGAAPSPPLGDPAVNSNRSSSIRPVAPAKPNASANGRARSVPGPVISPRANAATPPPAAAANSTPPPGATPTIANPQPQQPPQQPQQPPQQQQQPPQQIPPSATTPQQVPPQPSAQVYQTPPTQQPMQQGQQQPQQLPYQVPQANQNQPSPYPIAPAPNTTYNSSGSSGAPQQSAAGAGVPVMPLPGGSIAVPSLPATPGVPGQPGLSGNGSSGSASNSPPDVLISR